MPDDDFNPEEAEYLFARLSLSKEDAERFRACAQPRELAAMVGDVHFYTALLKACSPRISAESWEGMKRYIDATKLAIALTPARDQTQLWTKLSAIQDRAPQITENANLSVMLEAAARADIGRLRIANPPSWILEWMMT
jgi:hypothetical protein